MERGLVTKGCSAMVCESTSIDELPVPNEVRKYTTNQVGGMTPGPTLVSQLKVDTIKSIPVKGTNTRVNVEGKRGWMGFEEQWCYVEWVDATLVAQQALGLSREDILAKGVLQTQSIGYCVVDIEDFLALAQTQSEEGYFEVLIIPRGMIQSVVIIETEGGNDVEEGRGSGPDSYREHRIMDQTS